MAKIVQNAIIQEVVTNFTPRNRPWRTFTSTYKNGDRRLKLWGSGAVDASKYPFMKIRMRACGIDVVSITQVGDAFGSTPHSVIVRYRPAK